MSETLVKVEGLYKKFTRDLKRGLIYGTYDTLRSMVGIDYPTDYLRKKEFWALEDINFELKRGEVLGLIGRNGSGKSTLLRLLTGIFPPDRGKITMRGRVGALIAVGAGFHPHMSGRENIFLNGSLLGMSRQEIKKRFEEIVEFAEIGEFIDAPVATYSSGMRVRLGFAIAVHIEPDILLVDEVLAVGDTGFRIKSLNKITDLLKNCAVIFVSHSMPNIARISSKAMLIETGQKKFYGNVGIAIDEYNNLFEFEKRTNLGSGKVNLLKFQIFENINGKNIETNKINADNPIVFKIKYCLDSSVSKHILSIGFVDKENNSIALLQSKNDNIIFENKMRESFVEVKIPNFFASGKYSLNLVFFENANSLNYSEFLAYYKAIETIQITGRRVVSGTPVLLKGEWRMENEIQN